MLYVPARPASFGSQPSNLNATYTDTGFCNPVVPSASANTKGSNTAMINGLDYDCYGLAIGMSGGGTVAATVKRWMLDILVDHTAGSGNAGSSWSTLIANLYFNSPTAGPGGNWAYRYFFPIFIPSGTAIGAAIQCSAAAAATPRVFLRTFAKPDSFLFPYGVGTKVQTIGATAASTTGVAVTPGTSALGSWSASLGTLSRDAFWWQLGIGSNDTTMTARSYLFDVGINATNKLICAQDVSYAVCGANEQASMEAFGGRPPIRVAPSGENVYVRGASAGGAPDSSMTAIVYALGG